MNIASGNQSLPLYDRRKRVQALRAHRRGVVKDEVRTPNCDTCSPHCP